jgi:GMP synthase-like glutamine amidotransferase
MTIRILLCDDFEGILTRDTPSYPCMFERLFDSAAEDLPIGPLEYEVYPVHRGSLPPIGDGGEKKNGGSGDKTVYLITGSRAGAYDDLPWIPPLEDWIRRAHGEGQPLAGICFGHQIVGQALGGTVRKSERGWGLGVRTVEIKAESRADVWSSEGVHSAITYFPKGRFSLIHSHQDQVEEPPPGAAVFAGNDFCPCAGMLIGKRTLTFQGHPEFTPAYARHLLDLRDGLIPGAARRAAKDSLSLPTDHLGAARWILSL